MNRALADAINECLSEIVEANDKVIVLNCDVAKSVGIREFGETHPDRYIQLGISEQDMALTAAGLASAGYIPVITTFAKFGSLRIAEQISTFIAYPMQNVKILVSHAGLSPAQDGVTHQAIEDVALMRGIPGMVVVEPFDATSCKTLFKQAVEHKGPVYFRMCRNKLYDYENSNVLLGKGDILRKGKDVVIITMGALVEQAMKSVSYLEERGISATVSAISTIKPIDVELILNLAKSHKAIVTAEELNVHGGLGEAVSSVLAENYPVKVKKVAIEDTFGQSGTYEELLKCYHIAADNITEACVAALKE